MKAILCEHWCGPEDLKLVDLPDPVPAPGEVVIEIRAAALNFFDLLKIQGRHQIRPALPFCPASEFSGVIARVGAGVSDLKPGDRVLARAGTGGASQQAAVAAKLVSKIPDNLDHDRAAGLTAIYTTALHALSDRGNAQVGESLVVLGAAGGTGLAAIEIGKLLGLRVIACASTDGKLEFCRAHGADILVNYARSDFKENLKRIGGERGIDLVFDPVGGDRSEVALRSLGYGGRFLVIGFAAGDIPRIPLNLPLLKSCDIRGVFQWLFEERFPAHARSNMDQIIQWASDGKLSSHVHSIFPLERIKDALSILSTGKAMGKVILHPQG
ncbi:NADPH:quinone oxidoreductase family protein [Bradyrhizobium sp. 195]|uniref:NADPH:quinone oxidoreductase family protein n=1 Tax=Bradyrhizobium sp. 195 TaxID=2782662 RepID=UPI0020006690|nr:NADPH:quinone oxidoreductase family protein [Bradyrhizobium sp. 195]UPK29921.1 NADPH:quinone oxidoreductase family protein [Bradyrhizobium sp. 195]